MGDSNGDWGVLAATSDTMAQAYSRLEDLPPPGESVPFEAFLVAKNLTRAGLLRMGARMKSPVVIAFPHPAGIKFRDLVTGKRSNLKGSKYESVKILKAGQACQGVLVVEGETDAARCALLYDELDIACLGAGALSFTASMAAQLEDYPLVLVGLDNDEAGNKGSEKILKAVPGSLRFPPPASVNDWCEVADGDSIPDVPVPVAPTDHVVAGLVFPDIRIALDADLSAPDQLVDDFMYIEGIHVFDGHPSSGKTSFVLSCARFVMEEKRHVIWLDHESGIRQCLRKLIATGVAAQTVIDFFHYTPFPKSAEDQLGALLDEWPNALVVVDSVSKALASAGIDENDNAQVTKWTVKHVEVCKRRKVPMALIDHISKNAKDSRYSRGAGAKLADTDVQWRIEKLEEFNTSQRGVVSFRLDKDREGVLPFRQYAHVGGEGGLDFEWFGGEAEEENEPQPAV